MYDAMIMFNIKSNPAYPNNTATFHGVLRHFMQLATNNKFKLLMHPYKIYAGYHGCS